MQVWKVAIKGFVPDNLDPHHRNVTYAALKRIILHDDPGFGLLPPASAKDSDGLWILDEVASFVAEHWERVAEVAWRFDQERFKMPPVKEDEAAPAAEDETPEDGQVATGEPAEEVVVKDEPMVGR